MTTVELIDIIAKEEQEFPRLFACYEEREYGTLFYNTKIKDHHDSNHAVIYTEKITDLSIVLSEIKEFYQSKNIVPAIYHPPVEDYFINNSKILKSCGYEFMTALDSRIMVIKNTTVSLLSSRLDIRQITEYSMIEDGSYFIEQDNGLSEIYKNCINKKGHYLFVGYFENKPVSLLSFHVSEYGCTRFDEMKTAVHYKNKGFAREMNKFAVNFCISNNLPVAYQWPAHGTSERITSEAGFQESFTLPFGWASYAIMNHFNE
jgi:hypothetical protein